VREGLSAFTRLVAPLRFALGTIPPCLLLASIAVTYLVAPLRFALGTIPPCLLLASIASLAFAAGLVLGYTL
jgi:uncharacterized membrane protein